MSGPGKTPEERAAEDPTTEKETAGLLGSLAAATRLRKPDAPAEPGTFSAADTPRSTAVATTVYGAANDDDLEALKALVGEAEAGGTPRTAALAERHPNGLTPWLVAAWRGSDSVLRWMLDEGVDTAVVSDNAMGASATHLAVIGGHFTTLHLLLTRGVADVLARDKQQCTPLVVAAQYGELMCAHLLIRSGADVHAVDENGDNALHWVAYKGHYEFVELLVNGIGQPPKDQTAESHAKAIDSADNFGQTVRPKRPCSTARSDLGSLTGSERAGPVCRRCTLRLCDATRGCWCGCSASARTRPCGTGKGATLQRRRARSSPTPTLGSACCSSGACAYSRASLRPPNHRPHTARGKSQKKRSQEPPFPRTHLEQQLPILRGQAVLLRDDAHRGRLRRLPPSARMPQQT